MAFVFHMHTSPSCETTHHSDGTLLRLHPQCLVHGSHLRDGAAVETASHPPPPPDRPNQAHDLARGKALTPQDAPALRAAGPGEQTVSSFTGKTDGPAEVWQKARTRAVWFFKRYQNRTLVKASVWKDFSLLPRNPYEQKVLPVLVNLCRSR